MTTLRSLNELSLDEAWGQIEANQYESTLEITALPATPVDAIKRTDRKYNQLRLPSTGD